MTSPAAVTSTWTAPAAGTTSGTPVVRFTSELDRLGGLVEAGVPLGPLGEAVLADVVVLDTPTCPTSDAAAQHPGMGSWVHRRPLRHPGPGTVALARCAPLAPAGPVLCSDCLTLSALPAPAAAYLQGCARMVRALGATEASVRVDRARPSTIDPHRYRSRGLSAALLAPLGEHAVGEESLAAAAAVLEPRVQLLRQELAARRAGDLARGLDRDLALQAACYSLTDGKVPGARRAPLREELVDDIADVAPVDDAGPELLDGVWGQLLTWTSIWWGEEETARLCADFRPDTSTDQWREAAHVINGAWDKLIVDAAEDTEPRWFAAWAIAPGDLTFSKRQLLSTVLAEVDPRAVLPMTVRSRRLLAVVAQAPGVLVRGLAVADRWTCDLGPVLPGDDGGVLTALTALWRPDEDSPRPGPLADPAAALAAARGVCAPALAGR